MTDEREDKPEDEEGDGRESGDAAPAGTPPEEPSGPPPPPPTKLPKHSWMVPGAPRGALIELGGAGVQGNAVDVRAPIRVLDHFERLVRIVRLFRSGLEVKRRGRLTEVQGAPRMLAVPATAGSYAVSLELGMPEGEMVAEDHGELEAVVELLGVTDDDVLLDYLRDLPERVGDELIEILRAASAFDVDLDVRAYRDGSTTAEASIAADHASARVGSLEDTSWSEPGVDSVRGRLFRIDTKRSKIAVDAEDEDAEAEPVVVEAEFPMEMLDELKAALRQRVHIEVAVLEERRPYERAARGRTVTVTSVEILGPST